MYDLKLKVLDIPGIFLINLYMVKKTMVFTFKQRLRFETRCQILFFLHFIN